MLKGPRSRQTCTTGLHLSCLTQSDTLFTIIIMFFGGLEGQISYLLTVSKLGPATTLASCPSTLSTQPPSCLEPVSAARPSLLTVGTSSLRYNSFNNFHISLHDTLFSDSPWKPVILQSLFQQGSRFSLCQLQFNRLLGHMGLESITHWFTFIS